MDKTEKIILFQGDSITDGGRLKGKENAWDLNHQMGHGYAFLINAAMGCRYPEKNLRFYNRGVSGNRVGDLYGRWMEDTICLKPDILSVMVGINDCGSTLHDGAGSSPARFEKIYQLMLEEAREANPGVKIVLCEPFALPHGISYCGRCRKRSDPLRRKIKQYLCRFRIDFRSCSPSERRSTGYGTGFTPPCADTRSSPDSGWIMQGIFLKKCRGIGCH